MLNFCQEVASLVSQRRPHGNFSLGDCETPDGIMALPDTIHTPGREETALILQFIVERPERKFNVG